VILLELLTFKRHSWIKVSEEIEACTNPPVPVRVPSCQICSSPLLRQRIWRITTQMHLCSPHITCHSFRLLSPKPSPPLYITVCQSSASLGWDEYPTSYQRFDVTWEIDPTLNSCARWTITRTSQTPGILSWKPIIGDAKKDLMLLQLFLNTQGD
jgi:hypothetical protein